MSYVVDHFSKFMNACDYCATKTGKSKLYHAIDLAYCFARYGCIINDYTIGEFYKYRSFDRANIMTCRGWAKIMGICNEPSSIHYLENKADFNEYFKDVIHRKWIGPREIQKYGKAGIENFVRECGSVIVKPLADMEGHGIYVVNSFDDLEYEANKIMADNVIVEEFITQHPNMVFGNKSVNTIRMFTILDNHGDVHFIKAILRCGVGNTVVDNYCAGGVIYPVDEKTGIVEASGMSIDGCHYVVHPGTNIIILGYQIPHWDMVLKEVTKAAKLIPSLRFVGWDVAITKDGVDIIEGNHNPLYDLIEFIGKSGHYKDMLKYALN